MNFHKQKSTNLISPLRVTWKQSYSYKQQKKTGRRYSGTAEFFS